MDEQQRQAQGGLDPDDPRGWHPGQLLVAGFPGTQLPAELAEQIASGRVGGVILFSRNIESPEQLRTLVSELYSTAPPGVPLLVSVDQEGGRVQRLREPWTRWPPMRRLGEHDDPATTSQVGAMLAHELADAGFAIGYSPVVDVDSNPENPVIGDRSFGRDPARVARHAVAFMEGLQGAGVAACAKHFPGHGDTALDSHVDLPRLGHDLERLREVELVPFVAMVEAGVASIMSAHVLFPRLDASRPATMSPEVMGLLRHELGYEGLVFTDDLEMGAVADRYDAKQRTLGPLEAGVDALLVCHTAELRAEMLRTLEQAPDALVEPALARMRAFKRRWARQGLGDGAPPYPAHQALAASLARD
jgi:beta-N-acetylhexosaminidase